MAAEVPAQESAPGVETLRALVHNALERLDALVVQVEELQRRFDQLVRLQDLEHRAGR